ncbi:MAG TPA: sugar ABC transporter permease [Chloroflexota bacterium]
MAIASTKKPVLPAPSRAERLARWRDVQFGWFLVLPSLALVVVVVLYPLAYSLWISLHSYTLTRRGEFQFIGLTNYTDFLTSPRFWGVISTTTLFTVISVFFTLVLGIGVALVLNQSFVGRRLVRSLILLPWVLPTVVVGTTWLWIYNGNYGALNGLLLQLGLITDYRTWLGDPGLALYMVIAVKVWKEVPFVALILLASLQGIPRNLYEAARIDGASTVVAFRRITLPLLKPGLLVVSVLQTMWAFRVFDIIFPLTGGGPADKTMVVAYLTYHETFKGLRFGSGAALSYIVTLIIMGIALLYIKLLSSEVEY